MTHGGRPGQRMFTLMLVSMLGNCFDIYGM
jgi:hypothetical protein